MQKDQLRNLNPNHLHGSHPFNLRDYFGESSFSLIVKKPKDPFPPISSRLRLLERILSDISQSDLPGKEYFSEYMRQKYRRNCKPNTLRLAAGSLIQFLSFYRDTGKQHLEQMTREDIEAFIELLQDRGLTPDTVRTRLCGVYAFVRFLILVEGRIRHVLGRRILDKQINKLNNHFIVCGYGRMGQALCGYLIQRFLNIVVIEQNPDRVPVMDKDGILYIVGGATDEATLIKAGVKRARGIISVPGSDADNVFLVLIAKRLNPDIFVVARANQNESEKTLYDAGTDKVVSPFALGARRIAHAILRPTVIHFLELAFVDDNTDIHVEEMTVSASSKIVGVSLKDSGLRQDFDLIVISIKKADGTMCFNPKASYQFEVGDTIVVVGNSKSLMLSAKTLNP